MPKNKPRLLTGIRPTANLHIGNYIGAIKPMVDLQNEYSIFFCIVDLHAIVTPYNPKKLPEDIKNNTLDYLASGFDPIKTTLFIQSHVPQHVELMWLLNTLTPLGELQRMTQYKDFKEKYGDPQAGILNYPILMVADVIVYKAVAVPIGEDQNQHMELTRTIVKKFNRAYGETFPIPKTINPAIGARILSLNDPTKKMSKSLGSKSYIALKDHPDVIRKKIMTAVTDTEAEAEKMSAGVENLFLLLKLTSEDQTYQHMMDHYKEGKLQYAELKSVLADHVIDYLKPIQEKRKELEKNLDYVVRVLAEGSEKARAVASQTLEEVKKKMGLL